MKKYRSKEMVEAWITQTRAKFAEFGVYDLAKELHVVSGKFDVEELNKIISISGYVGKWYKNNLLT